MQMVLEDTEGEGREMKGILFGPWKIKRLLEMSNEGIKEMRTMRVMKHQPTEMDPCYYKDFRKDFGGRKPRYNVGDILWPREAWHCAMEYDGLAPRDLPDEPGIWYEADAPSRDIAKLVGRLRPGMFLPKRFARPQRYIVTRVGVQRPQELTNQEMIAEGIYQVTLPNPQLNPLWGSKPHTGFILPIHAWKQVWTTINGAKSWAANPWCWVYWFRVAKPEEVNG